MIRVTNRSFILLSLIVLILLSHSPLQLTASSPNSLSEVLTTIDPFEFTLTNGSIVNILDFADKPILLEWSASWCTVCSANHQNINKIYAEYKQYVNFLSISYKNSNDDLDKVRNMKGSFEWFFGLDHTNYAQTVDAQNADTWILYPNLTRVKTWDYSIVSVTSLKSQLNNVLIDLNTINSTEGISSSPTSPPFENLWALDLLIENPLFLGFLGVMIAAVLVVAVLRLRQR